MTPKQRLIDRLVAGDPGWESYRELLRYVESLDFELVENKYMGNFIVNGANLVFGDPDPDKIWPDWLPAYVPALYGMQGCDWEMAGWYAGMFENSPPERGGVFSYAGNDESLGFPLIEIPEGLFTFQSNESGASFFINTDLQVLYPSSEDEDFKVLDSLDGFTRTNITQALTNSFWFDAYRDAIDGALID